MNTMTMDDANANLNEKPGAQLAAIRAEKGYSVEYVAGKLHLRVRIIELLEADDYHNMPEPVFIKGYLRAYANLLDISFEPLLELFNKLHRPQESTERALWQSRRETHKAEHAIRWITALFTIGVLASVAVWWHKNKENEKILPTSISSHEDLSNQSSEIRLADLSKIRNILSSDSKYNVMEKQSG